MKSARYVAFILILFSWQAWAQLFQGPANGSVASGVSVSTGAFIESPPESFFRPRPMKNLFTNTYLADSKSMPLPTGPMGSNFFKDPILAQQPLNTTAGDFQLTQNFQGIPDQGVAIPPDPHIAVGPTQMVAVVNSRFRIIDKTGTVLNTIESSTWFSSTLSGADPFDPKVIYDSYSKRFVMVWLHAGTSDSYYLISVSDDSVASGTWYNYKMDATLNGTTGAGNWSDYQGVGFDQSALYITANQFTFAGNFDYVKIRIINKAQLYANTLGAVNWKDLWDVRDPAGNKVFGLRPSRAYDSPSSYPLVARSAFVTGTYFTLYKITNPLTSPGMTAANVSVTSYSDPQNMGQLGNANLIDGGDSGLRNEPVQRNGKLYFVHAVKSGTGGAFSSVRYVVLEASTSTVLEDKAMGADNYYHSYPALDVDAADNMVITYTRSGTSEYAGAFYTTRPSGSVTATGSKVLKAGAASYYKTFGGSRNRWGDYMGASVDPAVPGKIWVLTEYVASSNTWGTWIGGLTYSNTTAVVTVVAPDGGEVWAPASSKNITWSSSNVTNVKIEYSTDNGTSWSVVAASVAAASGTYAWTVPNTPSTNCLVKISDAANAAVSDVSNSRFTIGVPQAGWTAVTSGTTGDIWSIDWVNANVVWLCASTGDVKVSLDAGNTWSAAGNAGEGAYSIVGIDATTAVVALGPSSGDGKIMRTTNTGAAWTQVYTAAGAWFNFVGKLPGNVLWALSDPISGVFHIVKSTNLGVNWTLCSNLPAQPATNVFGANSSFYSIGNTLWFGTGGSSATLANRVYRSTNGPDGPWTFANTTAQYAGSLAFSSATGNGVVGFWQATTNVNLSANGGTSFTNQTTAIGTVSGLAYIEGTSNVFAATANGIFRSTNNGVNWNPEQLPAGTFTMYSVKFHNNVNSDKGLAGGAGGVLLKSALAPIIPVELTTFTANTVTNAVTLQWTTATERNNRGFEIERKINGTWATLGFVTGRGTTTEPASYTFTDDYADYQYRGIATYRLRQMDYDGRSSYSDEVNVDIDFTAKEYALYQNHPNPFNPSTTISYALPVSGKVQLAVYDGLGREVAVLVNAEQQAGMHTVQFNGSALSSGIYYYKLQAGGFTQVKKLMLVK